MVVDGGKYIFLFNKRDISICGKKIKTKVLLFMRVSVCVRVCMQVFTRFYVSAIEWEGGRE